MKLEIKSVLIGLLLGINIMLLMGTAPAPAPAPSGKYQIAGSDNDYIIMDTSNGELVRAVFYRNGRISERRF